MGPQTYEWYFDDIPEGGHYGEHASVGFSEPLVNFTPGFDASRSADKTVFTASGNQILTITVMPKEAMAWFGIHVFVSEDDKVVPTITSPTTDEAQHYHLTDDGSHLEIKITNPEVGTPTAKLARMVR